MFWAPARRAETDGTSLPPTARSLAATQSADRPPRQLSGGSTMAARRSDAGAPADRGRRPPRLGGPLPPSPCRLNRFLLRPRRYGGTKRGAEPMWQRTFRYFTELEGYDRVPVGFDVLFE
jgi:hypothetical protein